MYFGHAPAFKLLIFKDGLRCPILHNPPEDMTKPRFQPAIKKYAFPNGSVHGSDVSSGEHCLAEIDPALLDVFV